jgi:SAM-dependent methyltransferase
MTEFWEKAFNDKQEMWGFEPAESAVIAKDYFVQHNISNVLIPGIGYGRNARLFLDQGIQVTGIEISQTAIDLAQKHLGNDLTIFKGSVTDMPFDDSLYDGIFCYGLIHLLDRSEREKLIQDCYDQLAENGFMIFTTITKNAETYGKGTVVGKDRFEMFGGVNMFFYDVDTIQAEFGSFGLFEITEVSENYPFYLIKCQKKK